MARVRLSLSADGAVEVERIDEPEAPVVAEDPEKATAQVAERLTTSEAER